MWNPEVARLRRRVAQHDESLRALADTILDIQETVGGHTEILNGHTAP
jgi:hypothetical protein